jgi:hypothetical protein
VGGYAPVGAESQIHHTNNDEDDSEETAEPVRAPAGTRTPKRKPSAAKPVSSGKQTKEEKRLASIEAARLVDVERRRLALLLANSKTTRAPTPVKTTRAPPTPAKPATPAAKPQPTATPSAAARRQAAQDLLDEKSGIRVTPYPPASPMRCVSRIVHVCPWTESQPPFDT